jgi:lantibiotic modifying enzyme
VLHAVRARLGAARVAGAWRRCAQHLLAMAEAGGDWWHGLAGHGLTGFAHGSAGIVLALQLLDADGSAEPLARWQEQHFVAADGGWRDLRSGPDGPVTTTWCNGTSGIGSALAVAARLGLGDPARLRSVAAATARRPGGAVLNICDGDLGVSAFLLDAGVATDDDEWIAAGRRIAANVAARVLTGGEPATPNARLDRRAGLMNGYAGVVAGLLHAADPWSVPSATSVGLNVVRTPAGAAPAGPRS